MREKVEQRTAGGVWNNGASVRMAITNRMDMPLRSGPYRAFI
ncbi:MAG: hypothetical protein RIB71_12665 [Imperialibacter sp.]